MSYTVLARRYRSQTFDEVVGQEHIARTLRNAIEQDRTAHAYLFVGTRGVGKTSMARIFAKAINGAEAKEDVARAIMSGEDVDVIEIDAASNRGVDEAREVIANATYRPMRGPYKIYIIDEVHMLTREAFNALLKTMEEPPEHVKFILCTTEAHKVPATIQSRCQRFDFRAINTDAIAQHLKRVLEQESLDATEELVFAVARLGHGSMRDALSILDRLLAALEPGQTLDTELLQRLMGLPEQELLNGLIEAFADSDPATAMTASDELIRRGIAPDQLLIALADTLRDLMVISVCGDGTTLVDATESQREAMSALAARFDAPALVHMVALVESVGLSMKHAVSPRAIFDALMVRMAMTEKVADAAALLKGAPARTQASPQIATKAPPRKAPAKKA